VLALASAACSDVTGVEEIRTEMLPPPVYETLWERVQACSGHTGDFRRLRWYWVRFFPDGAAAKAQWNGRHEITLALAALDNHAVVAHELLHELLEGDPVHADPAWDVCSIPRGDG
jgi:hypothetical protein